MGLYQHTNEREIGLDKMNRAIIEVTVKNKYEKSFQKGYPLIHKDAIVENELEGKEGAILHLKSAHGKWIAKGYYGIQNKGIGWALTIDQQVDIDVSFFKQKLEKALSKRKSFFTDPNTTAFRVFNGEGDGIGGLTIDYFDGCYLMQWYSLGIYSYKEEVLEAFEQVVDYQAIYEKKRFDHKGQYIEDDDFVKGTRPTFPIIVKENGMHYAVYLNDGAMVGIFLDQREVRQAIREKYANGKHVLNTFSYTGAFSVAAALGGARKTTSVDLAKRSKPKTVEQFEVNGIDVAAQDIVVMDVFDYFKYAKRKGFTFDMIILDPPSFARSKKRTFSTAKDYPMLLKEAVAILEEDGFIVASTNNASFGMNKFKGFIEKAFREMNASYKILEEFSLPADFQTISAYPEGNYLKVVILQRTS